MTFEVGVLLAASALAMQLVTLVVRRELRDQLPYAGLCLAVLGLLLVAHATHQDGALVGWLGFSLALVLAFAPRTLESFERRALLREDLSAALFVTRLRELLVPGLMATRRRRQLENLVEARAGGAARVLRRLAEELARARGEAEVATIVLERTTVLFMAQRYRECIDEAARLSERALLGHPEVGVYRVRAHAELGELDDAAKALATVENGAARDPSALGLLTQGRLTLLAFAGRGADVRRLLASDARLFLTGRAHEFFTATAAQHENVPISPGLSRFLDGVAERSGQVGRPLVLRKRRAPVTLALIFANVAVAVLGGHFFSNDPPATALIRDGALFRPAVEAGEWWRAFSAMFMHGGPWHLGLNMFAVFVLGRFCEELFDPWRYFVIYIAAGLAGAVGSTVNHRQMGLTVGASGAIMGLLGAIIVILILRRGTWPEAWRRALLWNLSTLGALQIYFGFQLPMVDNAAHVGGLLGGGAMALLIAKGGLLGRAARVVAPALASVFFLGLVWTGVSIWRTPLSQTMSRLPTKIVSVAGKKLLVPSYWEEDPAHDVVRDPYLGVQIGRAAERDDATPIEDPALARLIDSIAKPAPVP